MEECVGKKIAEIICRAWNSLDASLFEPLLSDDFEYISVWGVMTLPAVFTTKKPNFNNKPSKDQQQ